MAQATITVKNSSPNITATVTTTPDGYGTYSVYVSLNALSSSSSSYGYNIYCKTDDRNDWTLLKDNSPSKWSSGQYTCSFGGVPKWTTVSFRTTTGSGSLNTGLSINYDDYGSPSINAVTVNPSRTGASFSVSYTNGAYAYHDSTTWDIGGLISYADSGSIDGLLPNTTYNWSVVVRDTTGSTASRTGSITTTCNRPTINSVNITPKIGGFTINVNADGDYNAPITKYVAYYRIYGSGGDFSSKDNGSNSTIELNGLGVDTDYEIKIEATNAAGTTPSNSQFKATKMNAPQITNITSEVTPFTATVTVYATINPEKDFNYSFSDDDGSTWSEPQISNSYTFTGLSEESEYTFKVKAIALHSSVYGTDTQIIQNYSVITPADQARVRIKTDNGWIKGKMYYKINDTWVKAKKVYIKNDNSWIIGKND